MGGLSNKYEPVKIQNLLPKGLSTMNLNLPPSIMSSLVAQAGGHLAGGRGRGRPVGSYKSATQMMAAARSIGSAGAAANLLYQSRASSLLHQVSASQYSGPKSSSNAKGPQQPSISITPLPRGGATQTQAQQKSRGLAGQDSSGGKPSFVICEICDGYIKDLEQLRNHMNLIHKVRYFSVS